MPDFVRNPSGSYPSKTSSDGIHPGLCKADIRHGLCLPESRSFSPVNGLIDGYDGYCVHHTDSLLNQLVEDFAQSGISHFIGYLLHIKNREFSTGCN